jgi:hypothetical protein
MKWKGRRVSKNVEDQTDDEAIRSIIANSTVPDYTGGVIPGAAKKQDRMKSLPEKAPIPTPRPTKGPRIIKTQVTPGKWTTN